MAFVSVEEGKKIARCGAGLVEIEQMSNRLTQDDSVSKLLSMTDNVVIRNQAYKRARRSTDEAREYGKLDKSVKELQQTAEHFRKAGQP